MCGKRNMSVHVCNTLVPKRPLQVLQADDAADASYAPTWPEKFP